MVIKTTAKGLIDFLNYTKNECDGYVDAANQIAQARPKESPNILNNQYYMYKDTVEYCNSQIKCITKKYSPRDIIEIDININE